MTQVLTITKNVEAKLPVWMQWGPWISGEQDQLGGSVTLSTSTWAVESDDGDTSLVVSSSPAPSINGTIARCWIEGGAIGHRYRLVNRISTSAGHTAVERTMLVLVDA